MIKIKHYLGIFITIILTTYLTNGNFQKTIYANTETEKPALEFTKVDIKNKSNDSVELKINSLPESTLLIKEDSAIATINPAEIESFAILNKIKIIFKSEITEQSIDLSNKTLLIKTTKSGLTGTSEQLTIETEEGKIVDAICWQNETPPESEQKDLQKILEQNIWSGPCLDSSLISNNAAIEKTGERRESSSWTIIKGESPDTSEEYLNPEENSPPKAVIKIQKGEISKAIPFSLNLDGSESKDPDGDKLQYFWSYPFDQSFEKVNPPSFRFEEEGNFTITLTVTDPSGLSDTTSLEIKALRKPTKSKKSSTKKYKTGDLSSNILISEVLPNPTGTDKDQEFLEIFNSGSKDINLGNWKIINNKKEITLSDELIIKANKYLILNYENSKISLKNSDNNIQLLDPNNKKISNIGYKKTEEGLSYSLNKIQHKSSIKSTWLWTKPSKNKSSPILIALKGIIKKEPTISKEYYFGIESNSKNLAITFQEPQHKFEILNNTLKPGTPVSILAIPMSNNKLKLVDYKSSKNIPTVSKQEKSHKNNTMLYFLVGSIAITGASLVVLKITKKS